MPRGLGEHLAIGPAEPESTKRPDVGSLLRRENTLHDPEVSEKLRLSKPLERCIART